MTTGTDLNTADGMTHEIIETISQEIKKGTYKWTNIRRKEVKQLGKKKKRPLGIPKCATRYLIVSG